MTIDGLRTWVVRWSFGCAGVTFLVFLLLPLPLKLFGVSMTWAQSWKFAQICLPVFAGYIASAAAFASGQSTSKAKAREIASDLLVQLTKFAFYFYIVASVALLGVYIYSQRPSGEIGSGMSSEDFATWIAGILSFLTVTTNSLILMLFGRSK